MDNNTTISNLIQQRKISGIVHLSSLSSLLLLSLSSSEAILTSENEKHLGGATQFVYDVASSTQNKTKTLALDIIQTQKVLRQETHNCASKLDKVIESSSVLTKESKLLENESLPILELETWITNTTSEIMHFQSQILFLQKIMEDEKKQASP